MCLRIDNTPYSAIQIRWRVTSVISPPISFSSDPRIYPRAEGPDQPGRTTLILGHFTGNMLVPGHVITSRKGIKSQHALGALTLPDIGRPTMKLRIVIAVLASVATLGTIGAVAAGSAPGAGAMTTRTA